MGQLQERARQRISRWMDADPTATQTAVGRALKVSQVWVSRYRAGAQDADIDQLETLAHHFGHTLAELLDLRPDPQEEHLLTAFRALPAHKRLFAVTGLEMMLPDPPTKRRSSGKP